MKQDDDLLQTVTSIKQVDTGEPLTCAQSIQLSSNSPTAFPVTFWSGIMSSYSSSINSSAAPCLFDDGLILDTENDGQRFATPSWASSIKSMFGHERPHLHSLLEPDQNSELTSIAHVLHQQGRVWGVGQDIPELPAGDCSFTSTLDSLAMSDGYSLPQSQTSRFKLWGEDAEKGTSSSLGFPFPHELKGSDAGVCAYELVDGNSDNVGGGGGGSNVVMPVQELPGSLACLTLSEPNANNCVASSPQKL